MHQAIELIVALLKDEKLFVKVFRDNTVLVVGKWGFWDIDLGNFRKLGQFSFLNLNFAEKSKNKRKKYKN